MKEESKVITLADGQMVRVIQKYEPVLEIRSVHTNHIYGTLNGEYDECVAQTILDNVELLKDDIAEMCNEDINYAEYEHRGNKIVRFNNGRSNDYSFYLINEDGDIDEYGPYASMQTAIATMDRILDEEQ